MGDILTVAFILLVVGGLGAWFLHGVFGKPSRRDKLTAEIYNLNQPMTWEDAQKEADFWLDYWAK